MYKDSFIFPSQEKRNDFINRLLFLSILELNKNSKIKMSFIDADFENAKLKFIFDQNLINIYFIENENSEYGLLLESNEDLNFKNIFFKVYIELYCENNKYLFTEEYKSILEIYFAEV